MWSFGRREPDTRLDYSDWHCQQECPSNILFGTCTVIQLQKSLNIVENLRLTFTIDMVSKVTETEAGIFYQIALFYAILATWLKKSETKLISKLGKSYYSAIQFHKYPKFLTLQTFQHI